MKTILFVDDDERILKTANMYFKNKYTILLAENTAQAFTILESTPIDVIVSDYGMMGGNGVEFKTNLNNSVHKNIPFIVVSGEINKESSIKFANLKVEKIIEKPLDLSQLDLVLKEIIKENDSKKDEKKMSFIGKKTGQIIHDINNSLGIILMSSDLGETVNQQPEKVQLLFSKSKKACNKITDIIKKYKTLANNEDIELKDYTIKEFETILEKEVKEFSLANEVDISLVKCDSDKNISLDLTLIIQVFLNLIANSRDAIKESNIDKPGIIKIIFNLETSNLLIKITDNGGKIPEIIREKLFQEKNSSKGNKGTGMGLTYCKEIIDLHLGKIWLSNSDYSGTEFSIQIPLNEKEKS